MRLPALPFAVAAALLCGTAVIPARAQGPVNQQPDASPGEAGGVPTLQQHPAGVVGGGSDSEPARAPGSTADLGSELKRDNENSGTTTYYPPPKADEVAQWPCAQRKVPTISAGTIWSGPDVAEGTDWADNEKVAALAQTLASRRTTLDQVDQLVGEFAKEAGKDKDKKLTELFVGTLDIINGNRSEILQGIMRYAQGQERLAERMRDESDKISEAQSDVKGPTGIAATESNRDFAWDQRIFKERKQALSYVCETPSILERRAYEVGKRIQAQL